MKVYTEQENACVHIDKVRLHEAITKTVKHQLRLTELLFGPVNNWSHVTLMLLKDQVKKEVDEVLFGLLHQLSGVDGVKYAVMVQFNEMRPTDYEVQVLDLRENQHEEMN